MLQKIANALQSVNKKRNDIKNPLTRFVYTLLVQLPMNLLARATEIVTEPVMSFGNHVWNRQQDNLADYSDNSTRGKYLINSFAQFKNRLALTLKLPMDLVVGLIKAVLALPRLIVQLPNKILRDSLLFLNKYTDEATPAVVRGLAKFLHFLIRIPAVILGAVDSVLFNGFPEMAAKAELKAVAANDDSKESNRQKRYASLYRNLSVAGALSLIESGINGLSTLAARVLVEIGLSPITILLRLGSFVASKLGGNHEVNVDIKEEQGKIAVEATVTPPAQKIEVNIKSNKPVEPLLMSGGPATATVVAPPNNVVGLSVDAAVEPEATTRSRAASSPKHKMAHGQ